MRNLAVITLALLGGCRSAYMAPAEVRASEPYRTEVIPRPVDEVRRDLDEMFAVDTGMNSSKWLETDDGPELIVSFNMDPVWGPHGIAMAYLLRPHDEGTLVLGYSGLRTWRHHIDATLDELNPGAEEPSAPAAP